MAQSGTRNTQRSTSSRTLFRGSHEVALPRLVLIVSVFALLAIGLVMVYSSSTVEAISEGASPESYLRRQALIAVAAVIACAVLAAIPYYAWLNRLLDAFWLVTMLLLIVVAVAGTVGLGAKRWIVMGPVRFQPSEIAKVVFVLMLARILYQYRIGEADFETALRRATLFVLVPLAGIYLTQSDLGTTLICLVGLLAVLWFGEVPLSLFWGVVGVVALFGVLAIFFVGYRADRLAFLDPYADPYDSGYQLIRSFYAFGEGGLFGVGLGNSREKYLYLPEAETDFIFAIIGEELGLVGALAVIALFAAVLWAGLKIARNAPDLFGTMIAGGCTVMLVFQAFLNIGCVMGVLPTTGKPLPFISSGGSALIGSFLLVAMMLSVSFASGDESGIYERRRADLRVVRSEDTGAARTRRGR